MAGKIVNITQKASAEGLRAELEKEAQRRGKTIRPFVGAIYSYAVKNNGKFSGPLKSSRRKPGDHIGAQVAADVAAKLEDWAKKKETTRGLWCCFLLEKALEDKMLEKIFGSSEQ
jgi:hypothetical protein